MPFGNSGAEDFVLGQTTAFGSRVAKEYKKSTQKKRQRDLMNYMMEMGRQQQISNTSLPTTYDPNVVDEKEVRLVSMGRGQKPHPAVVSKQNDLNILKDMATFAAKDPKTFKNVFDLSILQSPVKAVGAIGEATWARGNDNYQNDLSEQFFNSVNQGNIESWNKQKNMDDPTTGMGQSLGKVGTGSYDDKMKRIEAFMMNQEIIKSMKPDFTSDFTAGDAADTASWFIPGPGMLGKFAKTGVKTGAAVGKTVKDARTALAASKAAGFAGDFGRGTKMGLGMVGGFGTGGIGGVPLGLARKVNKARVNSFLDDGTEVFNDAERASENAAIDELSRSTETMANKQGIPISDVATKMRERATGTIWDTHVYNPETQTYTIEITGRELDREGIKMAAYNTLVGGAERQKKYGNPIDELPNSPDDIPDDFVDRILESYHGHHRVADSQGRNMAHYGLTLDHNISLKKGGANTLDNLVAMLGKTNFGKGG